MVGKTPDRSLMGVLGQSAVEVLRKWYIEVAGDRPGELVASWL